MTEDVSLRPLALRPGAAGPATNPFSTFGMGAGAALRSKPKPAGPVVEERRKPASEIIRYDMEFLMKFGERYTKLPPQMAGQTELLLDGASPEDANKPFARPAEQTDERDWRSRTALPPAPEGQAQVPRDNGRSLPQEGKAAAAASSKPQAADRSQPPQQAQQETSRSQNQQPGATAASQPAPTPAAGPTKIQRAEDIGRKAWAPGGAAQGDAKALKAIKGILNKLTPEKFDRLLSQLLEQVTSAEVLHGTIALVFENAVAQPTFVEMYANLCEALSKDLPEYPPAPGEYRPMTFKRVLLNTCQEEFEGAAANRQALASAPEEEREGLARKAKMRTLGTIRLVAELYKKSVVNEKIVHMCFLELRGSERSEPHEDNMEAMCELLSVAGKKLEGSVKARLDEYFATLARWARSKGLTPRVRFMIRDVTDLRTTQWIPRRQEEKAKKISEIHAAAHAELGMVTGAAMPVMPGLAKLPPVPLAVNDDVELFPGFKSGAFDWEAVVRQQSAAAPGMPRAGSQSAFLGEYSAPEAMPPAAPSPAAAPAEAEPPAPAASVTPATPPQPTAAAPKAAALSDEERDERADKLYAEFLSSNDTAEAITCMKELAVPGYLPHLVRAGLKAMFDSLRPTEHTMLASLLVAAVVDGAVPLDDLVAGVKLETDDLSGLSMDVPKGPKLLGELLGRAIAEAGLRPGALAELLEHAEDVEPKRDLAATALLHAKEKLGEAKLGELCGGEGGFTAGEVLAADPEFDPPDTPDVPTWLAQQGLSCVPA